MTPGIRQVEFVRGQATTTESKRLLVFNPNDLLAQKSFERGTRSGDRQADTRSTLLMAFFDGTTIQAVHT